MALVVFYVLRFSIESQMPVNAVGGSPSLIEFIYGLLPNIIASLRRLFGPLGIHNLFNGFSLLTLISLAGLVLDRRLATPRIPGFLLLIIPYCFVIALLSDNLGRMFFAAYVPIIAYALIGIDYFCSPVRAIELH